MTEGEERKFRFGSRAIDASMEEIEQAEQWLYLVGYHTGYGRAVLDLADRLEAEAGPLGLPLEVLQELRRTGNTSQRTGERFADDLRGMGWEI
ncbi:hypothetical protein M2317_000053 [Microbacterium sp. ZKA21]|uniref:hypothetical protein n=1 Tax=Microbacterium sp. ZKA21 TaxID=3381694 RepID=UPI003D1D561F